MEKQLPPLCPASNLLNLTPDHERVAEILWRCHILDIVQLAPVDAWIFHIFDRFCHWSQGFIVVIVFKNPSDAKK